MMPPSLRLFALGAVLALAGCSSAARVAQCPSAAILSDTAVRTGFRPGAPADPSGEAYTARFTAVKTDCTIDRPSGRSTSSLDFTVRATRPPSAEAASYTLPYFVAVTQGERILSKQVFNLQISFAPGSAETTVDDSVAQTVIQLENGHPSTDYQLLLGFQLTAAERAYNEKRSRYLP